MVHDNFMFVTLIIVQILVIVGFCFFRPNLDGGPGYRPRSSIVIPEPSVIEIPLSLPSTAAHDFDHDSGFWLRPYNGEKDYLGGMYLNGEHILSIKMTGKVEVGGHPSWETMEALEIVSQHVTTEMQRIRTEKP